jgi:allene oxide cyclase-like protein
MGKARTLVLTVVAMVVLGTLTAGFATAQGDRVSGQRAGNVIHVVPGTGGGLQFFDFNNDGLTLGDRLASFGPLLNGDQTKKVGNAYLDCWVGDDALLDGSPYVCTHTLHFKDGNITTQGLDPHGVSDVFFSITGGTGAYEGATGQAEYIDSDTQTDIYLYLNG